MSSPEAPEAADPPDAPDAGAIDAFVRHEVRLALVFPILLLAAAGLSGFFLRDEVTAFASWTYQQLGFGGLALVLFVSETIISPLPPDVILWVVAGSGLRGSWIVPATILSLISMFGGHLGWVIGWRLGRTRLVRGILGRHQGRSMEVARRYGIWAVVLAALTPVPWSVTSWAAGALHMPWSRYALGSLARLPRITVYYFFIHAAFHRAVAPLG